MKLIISFVTLLVLLSGCNNMQNSNDIHTYTNDNSPPYIKALEDIIDTHGEIENKERFDEFLNRMQQGKNDEIRVVKYTVEGDPIIYEYVWEDGFINVTIDTTRDGYGPKEMIHTTCASMNVKEDQENTIYELDDCSPSIGDTTVLIINNALE